MDVRGPGRHHGRLGKTTLLRAATGQLIAQRGTVQAFGQDIAAVDAAGMQSLRKRMGVFQQGVAIMGGSGSGKTRRLRRGRRPH